MIVNLHSGFPYFVTVSGDNHPHICTLHDIGSNYLVMELVEGATLAVRLEKGSRYLAAFPI